MFTTTTQEIEAKVKNRKKSGSLDVLIVHSREFLESIIAAADSGKIKPEPGQYERWVAELDLLNSRDETFSPERELSAQPLFSGFTRARSVTATTPANSHPDDVAGAVSPQAIIQATTPVETKEPTELVCSVGSAVAQSATEVEPGAEFFSTGIAETVPATSEILEIYSQVALAGIVGNNGRAWFVWFLARYLAPDRSGKVAVEQLRTFLKEHGVSNRDIRRWIASAYRLKLFPNSKKDSFVFPVSVARAGVILKAVDIGSRSTIKLDDLFKQNWKHYVWAAFLVTLEGKPVSQWIKYQMTGVQPRLQRLWQAPDRNGVSLSYPKYHYANCHVDPGHVEALREITGWHYFVRGKHGRRVMQRLPDSRIVCETVSQRLPDGKRSRNIREAFELSSQSLAGTGEYTSHNKSGNGSENFRLFHEDPNRDSKPLKATLKKLSKSDSLNRPLDVFETISVRGRVKIYRTILV